MRQEDKLKEKVGTKMPYKVPEGYFESLKGRVMTSLPEYPEKPKEVKLSVWQRVRPYVYLAAMFAGIWCMMQIFHHISNPTQPANQNTEIALSDFEPDSYDLYIDGSTGEDLELQDEVSSLYSSMDEFQRDFYAQL